MFRDSSEILRFHDSFPGGKRSITMYWACKAFAAVAVATASTALGQHEGDIIVGRNASNQLVASGFNSSDIHALQPVSGLLSGWSGNNPGFDHLPTPQPANNLFPLTMGAQIRLQVVAISAAFRILGPGLSPILDEPGESLLLGGATLHEHVVWHVDATDTNYHADICLWTATLILRDTGSTGYADSAPFTLRFASQPAVGQDCNGNNLRDACDLALALTLDCNNNAVPDVCESLNPCSDSDVCTCDLCFLAGCSSVAVSYGDVTCNGGAPNLDDILCVLSGFSMFSRCPNADIAPYPAGSGTINLDDILAVLSAFAGNNPCR